MNKQDEIKYFDKEWQAMEASLKSFLKTELQEDLHRFRVQVKKIRALLILAESAQDDLKLIKFFKPVRNIFKHAGEIRNRYVNLNLVYEYKINTDTFVTEQHQLMSDAIKRFKSNGDKYLEEVKAAHKAIRKQIKHISDVHIALFYQNHLQQISGCLLAITYDDQLHQCRKWVKILIYNHKLAHQALANEFNEDYLDQVQTAIGNWHDNMLAKELFLENNIIDKASLVRLQKQHTKYRKNIANLTNDFYNRATTAVEVPVEQLS